MAMREKSNVILMKKRSAKGNFLSIRPGENDFLLKFLAAFAFLFLVVLAFPMRPLLTLIAQLVTAILNAAGTGALSQGTVIYSHGLFFEIVNECSSLVMISLLAALLYATEGMRLHIKARSLAIGAAVLFLFNLARLSATIEAGVNYGNSALDAIHFLLWIVDAVVVIALWAYFTGLHKEIGRERKPGRK
ncbi:exosortase/archaeosortase family protein [Candidatus Micrarchaeota archaeon]|nr:exosortase/archaeosortase family protein [Candidatus Micrarchaeota archaeon]